MTVADFAGLLPADFWGSVAELFGFLPVGLFLVGFGWLAAVPVRFGVNVLRGGH